MNAPRGAALVLLLVVVLGAVAVGVFVIVRGVSQPALRVGEGAPEFTLRALDGTPVALEELRGRVVFVNFWATWCPPCREEAPSMKRMHDRLGDVPFEMLAISIDAAGSDDKIRAFRDEFAWDFPVLVDPDKHVYDSYQAYGVPESFLIDTRGRVAERFIGPKDWDQPRYAHAIRRLIEAGAKETSGG